MEGGIVLNIGGGPLKEVEIPILLASKCLRDQAILILGFQERVGDGEVELVLLLIAVLLGPKGKLPIFSPAALA